MNFEEQYPAGLVKLNTTEALNRWSRLMYYSSSQYVSWKQQCTDNRAFYYGNQYSQPDSEVIAARGQYEIVVNKIRKAIRGIVGILASSLPKYKIVSAVGDDAFDNYITTLSNRILDWTWQNSGGVHLLQRATKRAAVDNISYIHVIYTMTKKIKYELLAYDDVIVDPASKHPTFDDAEQIVITKKIAVEKAKAIYKVGDDISIDFSPITAESSSDKVGALMDFLGKVYDTSKRYVTIYECYRKVYIRGMSNAPATTRIIKETMVGYRDMYREILPESIRDYPIVPVYSEDTENPYKQGEVAFLKDLQQFINKCFGVVILNAQTLSNPKIIVKETDIPNNDITAFTNNYANPGSVSVMSQNAMPPVVIPGQPLNSAFFQLYMEASAQLEAATIPREMMGFDSKMAQKQSVSVLFEWRESVIDSYKDFMSNIELALAQLGRVSLQYAKAYLNGEFVIKVFGNRNDVQRVVLNQRRRVDLDNPEAVAQYKMQALQAGSTEEKVDTEILEARENDAVAKALYYYNNSTLYNDYDVFVTMGSTTQTYESMMLRVMLELADRQVVGPEEILRYAPVENKEELMLKYDTVRRQTYQIEDLTAQIEELESTVKKLSSDVDASEKKRIYTDHEAKLYKIEVDKRAKEYLNKHLSKMMTREQISKLSFDLSKILYDAKEAINEIVRDTQSGNIEPEIALQGIEILTQRVKEK